MKNLFVFKITPFKGTWHHVVWGNKKCRVSCGLTASVTVFAWRRWRDHTAPCGSRQPDRGSSWVPPSNSA